MALNYGKLGNIVQEVLPFDLTKEEARKLVILIFDRIAAHVKKGEKVHIRDFGNFFPYKRCARRKLIAHWKDGKHLYEEMVTIPERTAMSFHTSRKLLLRMREPDGDSGTNEV